MRQQLRRSWRRPWINRHQQLTATRQLSQVTSPLSTRIVRVLLCRSSLVQSCHVTSRPRPHATQSPLRPRPLLRRRLPPVSHPSWLVLGLGFYRIVHQIPIHQLLVCVHLITWPIGQAHTPLSQCLATLLSQRWLSKFCWDIAVADSAT